jgi:hypothetical protein
MSMLKLISVLATSLVAGGAYAAANCPSYPKNEWMLQSEAKAKIEGKGYVIKKFKVDGNCYEIYGTTREGKRAEVYFDVKTLEVVKAEIGK